MRVQESGPNGEERPPRQGGERWLDLVFRQMPGAAWATDRELRLRWVLGRIPGVEDSAADFVGQTVCDYVGTTNDADPAVAAHREALEGRSARFRYELRDRCYEVLIEPLEAGQAGVIGTVGAAVDVTERQRAERQLEESLSLLTATLNATGDGILVIDREGHVTAVNERFLELWRLPRRLVEEGTNDRLIAAVLDQLLEPEAFQRRVAREALPALDVMLLDMRMPRLSGAELLDALAREDSLSRVPVVVLSGDESAREEAEERGVPWMKKPVDVDELIETVTRLAGTVPPMGTSESEGGGVSP